jgi:uncharacterized caspase-like protein
MQDAAARARRLSLVILDACRDNPFRDRLFRSGTRSIGRGLSVPKNLPLNSLVAFSAKDGSVANDGPPGRNSPYAEAMLRHLGNPGPEIGLLFREIRDTVVRATERSQEPWQYGSLSAENFYLGDPVPSPQDNQGQSSRK